MLNKLDMISDHVLKNKLVIAHASIMVFVWLIAVPFAIGANMYARKKRKTWGPRVHMLTMAIAVFLPYTLSAILAFTVSGELKLKPHSVTTTNIYHLLICKTILINHLYRELEPPSHLYFGFKWL
jgi:ABC-type dipeptide/oligopeptide/nickel transport system permease component